MSSVGKTVGEQTHMLKKNAVSGANFTLLNKTQNILAF